MQITQHVDGFCLFVVLLYVPVNNLSVISGHIPVLSKTNKSDINH